MNTSSSVPPTLRFGVFELDPRAGELRKKGMKIRLQGQPVEILAMLLQHPGETVTREELQKKLWPADTFVDFEQGLNNAMKRLRAALDDDAESPHFIETLPRHGYRFIGSVNGAERRPAAETPATRSSPVLIRLGALGTLVVIVVIAVLLALNVRGWRDRLLVRAPKTQIKVLAVLPLENLSGDPEQEYFADGVTEALITELGKIGGTRVISRQSIMQYKGSKKPLQEIAQELKVDAVLEGSVERSGDRVRVSVHLDQVSPESQLWARQFDHSLRDALALQAEIARAVTDEIQVKLTPEERAGLASRRAVNPEAQDDYLRGLYFQNHSFNSEATVLKAIRYFKQAIEKDPGYALAYSGLADAYGALGHYCCGGHPPKETFPLAKAAALKAMELDPSLAEAHGTLSWILAVGHDWPGEERELRLALKLNPNFVDGHVSYGVYLQCMGRNDEAAEQFKSAIVLDPLNPDHRSRLGWLAFTARQYDVAIREFQSVGYASWGWRALEAAYEMKGMHREAIAAAKDVVRRDGRTIPALAGLVRAYGNAGKTTEAQKLMDEIRELGKRHYVSPNSMAWAYIGLKKNDEALTWLERSYEEDDGMLGFIKVNPGMDPLRSEPRFQALLRRMNFPP